jgi:hypothetical protein
MWHRVVLSQFSLTTILQGIKHHKTVTLTFLNGSLKGWTACIFMYSHTVYKVTPTSGLVLQDGLSYTGTGDLQLWQRQLKLVNFFLSVSMNWVWQWDRFSYVQPTLIWMLLGSRFHALHMNIFHNKIQVKWSLCISLRHMRGGRGITQFILDFSTRCKCGHLHALPALPPVPTE